MPSPSPRRSVCPSVTPPGCQHEGSVNPIDRLTNPSKHSPPPPQGLVADALGRGDRERARELSQLLIKWGVAMGGLISLAFAGAELWAPESLPRFFTEDQGIMDKVENVLWVIAVMQPINGLVNVGAGVLQGAQDFTYQVRGGALYACCRSLSDIQNSHPHYQKHR